MVARTTWVIVGFEFGYHARIGTCIESEPNTLFVSAEPTRLRVSDGISTKIVVSAGVGVSDGGIVAPVLLKNCDNSFTLVS